jgi:hypothetical protein
VARPEREQTRLDEHAREEGVRDADREHEAELPERREQGERQDAEPGSGRDGAAEERPPVPVTVRRSARAGASPASSSWPKRSVTWTAQSTPSPTEMLPTSAIVTLIGMSSSATVPTSQHTVSNTGRSVTAPSDDWVTTIKRASAVDDPGS